MAKVNAMYTNSMICIFCTSLFILYSLLIDMNDVYFFQFGASVLEGLTHSFMHAIF